MTHYNSKIDLVNDIVFTKFCLDLLIRSQDIEQNPNYDRMTERIQQNDGIAPLFQSRAIMKIPSQMKA